MIPLGHELRIAEELMHSDHKSYLRFNGARGFEKSVNSLLGIVEGIAVDSCINPQEIAFLEAWLEDHQQFESLHPYCELIPVVRSAVADGMLSDEEKQDILWLCERLSSSEFVGSAAADIQRLHAMLGGISADRTISEVELRGLSDWLTKHEHLKSLWPYDEVDSLITSVLRDKVVDAEEHEILLDFFGSFTAILDERVIRNPPLLAEARIVGLCAVCPEIKIEGSTFCFTGASSRFKRSEFTEVVQAAKGTVLPSVSAKLNYLVVGAEGNPCWMYACYGRKVEKAVELRKQGARLLIIHENDFHDALAESAG